MRDVNDTGFELVLGRADWARRFGLPPDGAAPAGAGVVYDRARKGARLRSSLERLPGEAHAESDRLGPDDRTAVARDRFGSWYWIDPTDRTRILVRSVGDEAVTVFWPAGGEEGRGDAADPDAGAVGWGAVDPGPGDSDAGGPFSALAAPEPPPPQTLRALTITEDHRLVAAATEPDRLLVFDLHGGGPPRPIPWWGKEPFAPACAAARPDGGCYLVEAPSEGAPRVWALDRALRPEGPPGTPVRSGEFGPLSSAHEEDAPGGDEDGGGSAGDGASEEDARRGSISVAPFSLPEPLRTRALVVLPDDTVLLLHVGPSIPGVSEAVPTPESRVLHYRLFRAGAPLSEPDLLGSFELRAVFAAAEGREIAHSRWSDWLAHDVAFVPGTPGPTESVRGTVYAVGTGGLRAYALTLRGEGAAPELRYEDLPLRRFGGKGLVAAGEEVYYDFQDRWLPFTARPRRRFVEEGTMVSAPFDGRVPGVTWHRLFVDGCIPSGHTVRVESRAADREHELEGRPWQPEPALYRRGSGPEIPSYAPFTPAERSREGVGTWELLFQRAEGRYLQLRITLEGDRRDTPYLYALRAYAPRFSYLDRYLPAVYREDEESAHFLERFLANAEGIFTVIEGKIAAQEATMDVRTVPSEYLDWLATWFGAEFDPALDARRKRLFLDHAVELFAQRGTPAGIARMLHLIAEPCVDESLFTRAGIAAAVGRPAYAEDAVRTPYQIRIVERFAARAVPRASLGDPTAPEQPLRIRPELRWSPSEGTEILHRRFRTFLDRRYADAAETPEDVWGEAPAFPPLLPGFSESRAATRRSDWRLFVRQAIDGPYAEIDAGSVSGAVGEEADSITRRYRAFLRRRYRRIEALRAVYPDAPDRFSGVQLPDAMPTGSALSDWMHFAGLDLPVHEAAHGFTVLVPVDPSRPVAEQRERLELADRVVEREKPAHTWYDVLPYWAAFRAGAVRLGLDTVLGRGSRYAALLLGEGALSQATVGAAHPENVTDRRVLGRDASDSPHPV